MSGKIVTRYASAVRSGNLRSNPDTTMSDSDVIGAAGLAAKKKPLEIALLRLFTGDNHAAREIVELLASMVLSKAWYSQRMKIDAAEAINMAKAVLAWHRNGTCTTCGGLGFGRIEGTTVLGDIPCPSCRGSGRVPFDSQFPMETLELARWLQAEIESAQGAAGEAAMRALAPRLES